MIANPRRRGWRLWLILLGAVLVVAGWLGWQYLHSWRLVGVYPLDRMVQAVRDGVVYIEEERDSGKEERLVFRDWRGRLRWQVPLDNNLRLNVIHGLFAVSPDGRVLVAATEFRPYPVYRPDPVDIAVVMWRDGRPLGTVMLPGDTRSMQFRVDPRGRAWVWQDTRPSLIVHVLENGRLAAKGKYTSRAWVGYYWRIDPDATYAIGIRGKQLEWVDLTMRGKRVEFQPRYHCAVPPNDDLLLIPRLAVGHNGNVFGPGGRRSITWTGDFHANGLGQSVYTHLQDSLPGGILTQEYPTSMVHRLKYGGKSIGNRMWKVPDDPAVLPSVMLTSGTGGVPSAGRRRITPVPARMFSVGGSITASANGHFAVTIRDGAYLPVPLRRIPWTHRFARPAFVLTITEYPGRIHSRLILPRIRNDSGREGFYVKDKFYHAPLRSAIAPDGRHLVFSTAARDEEQAKLLFYERW